MTACCASPHHPSREHCLDVLLWARWLEATPATDLDTLTNDLSREYPQGCLCVCHQERED